MKLMRTTPRGIARRSDCFRPEIYSICAPLAVLFLYASRMSAFSAVLAPSSDGTLHVPIPENWIKQGVTAVLIKADIEPLGGINLNPEQNKALKGFGCLRGKVSLAPDFDEPIADFKEYSA